MSDYIHLDTDVLIIGAGAAGMSAAIAAHDAGVSVLLADRSLIGRGGATVMAQMTVAAAVGEEVPDSWEHHLADTLKAGRVALRRTPCATALRTGARGDPANGSVACRMGAPSRRPDAPDGSAGP